MLPSQIQGFLSSRHHRAVHANIAERTGVEICTLADDPQHTEAKADPNRIEPGRRLRPKEMHKIAIREYCRMFRDPTKDIGDSCKTLFVHALGTDWLWCTRFLERLREIYVVAHQSFYSGEEHAFLRDKPFIMLWELSDVAGKADPTRLNSVIEDTAHLLGAILDRMKKRIALHEADPSRSPLAVFARLHTHWTDRQAVDDERKLVQAIESIKAMAFLQDADRLNGWYNRILEGGDDAERIAAKIYGMRSTLDKDAVLSLPSELSTEVRESSNVAYLFKRKTVIQGSWLGQAPVAIKRCRGVDMDVWEEHQKLWEAYHITIDRFRLFSHSNVLTLHGWIRSDFSNRTYLVHPWMENGNAREYMERHPELSARDRVVLIEQILSGLAWLAGESVAYGVVRPDRIFISDEGHAVVGDFVFPELVKSTAKFRPLYSELHAVPDNARYKDLRPSPGQIDLNSVDLYSWSCTALEIVSGVMPFFQYKSAKDVTEAKIQGQTLQLEDYSCNAFGLYPDLWNLLQPFWEDGADGRLAAEDVLRRLQSTLAEE